MFKFDSKIKNCISIIGSSASGKSSVGPFVADRLQYKLYDTDKIVSEKIGKNIDEIFAEEGTEYFQKVNLEILKGLFQEVQNQNTVLVIGASPIQNSLIRKLIKQESSLVLGLYAEPEILIQRIKKSITLDIHAAHPLLVFEDDFFFSELLFEFREPFIYFADEIIDTSRLNIQEVCDQLIYLISLFLKQNI